jgi:hypothetical protein
MITVPGAAAAAAAAGDGQHFHFGRPDRGFASSDMDVSRLECGSGGKGGKSAAAAAVTERALASSAESTPQKAGQRCRLRPRRRLELQLKKRYLRKAAKKYNRPTSYVIFFSPLCDCGEYKVLFCASKKEMMNL